MPDFRVVADVSRTLRAVLAKGLSALVADAQVVLHDLRDKIGQEDLRVTIFLFEVVEDPSARNRPRTRTLAGDRVQVSKPGQALLLRYLITPWSPKRDEEHELLGRISQVLYERSILSGPDLIGTTLQNTSEALKVTQAPLTLEERTRIWHAVQQPYRLSLTYEARVVNVDSLAGVQVPLVGTRDLRFGLVESSE